jgi:hypothetical protein
MRLRRLGLSLSLNDCRVTVTSQFLKLLDVGSSPQAAVEALSSSRVELDHMAKTIFREAADTVATKAMDVHGQQLTLFSAAD